MPTDSSRIFFSLILVGISIFLLIYTWVPAHDNLLREEGRITNIISRPNTWYEVEIVTSSGVRVSCRTRRGWPLIGPSRCPLEKFEQYLGQSVTLGYDGKRPYEVLAGNEIVMNYSSHRQAQLIAVVISVMMLALSFLVWRRK